MAQIGDPVWLGNASATTGFTVALTLTAAVPAGWTVLVPAANEGGASVTSIVDDQGNAPYPLLMAVKPTGGASQIALALAIANPLPIGAKITTTWSNNQNLHQMGAIAIPGVEAIDREANNAKGLGQAPSISSGVMIQPSNELVIFTLLEIGGGADAGYIPDQALNPFPAMTGSSVLHWGFVRPPNRAPIVYGPQFAGPMNWGAKALVLRGSAPIAAVRRRQSQVLRGGAAPAPRSPVVRGYQYDNTKVDGSGNPLFLTSMSLLPASIYRTGVDNTKMTSAPAFYDTLMGQVGGAGYKVLANLKNHDVTGATNLAVPPPDPALYRAQITALLDRYPGLITWITVENEPDSGLNYQQQPPGLDPNVRDNSQAIADATAAAWIAQLGLAAQAVTAWNLANPGHAPVQLGAGGISSSGLKLARWYFLWTGGFRAQADAFAALAFAGANDDGVKASDLPTVAAPTRTIFAANTLAWTRTLQTWAMLRAIRRSGVRCFCQHLFGRAVDMAPQLDAFQWVCKFVGLPAISDAIGQKDETVLNTVAVASVAEIAALALCSWFGATPKAGDNAAPITYPDGSDNVQGPPGTLNARGLALASVIAAWP
ncbi:MAG: hypothetical protein ACR2F8_03040 [Caulobacteraceae bacterium]